MRRFGARVGRLLLIVWGIVTLLFVVFRLLGDPAELVAGQRADAATRTALRQKLGLDEPLYVQYLRYLHGLSPVGVLDTAAQATYGGPFIALLGSASGTALVLKAPDLGTSFQTGRPVLQLLAERLPATALLGLTSLLFAAVLGIALGAVAGAHAETALDRALSALAFLGVALPSFLVAMLFLAVFAVAWGDWTHLPVGGYVRQPRLFAPGDTWDLRHLVLPAATLAIRPLAVLFQLTRDGVRDNLAEPYARTATAKGLSFAIVLRRHVLPNALNPTLTALTGWFGALLAGTFFVEFVFDWPGLGKLTIDALLASDFPVLLGSALLTGLLFVVANALTDILHARLDPRLR